MRVRALGSTLVSLVVLLAVAPAGCGAHGTAKVAGGTSTSTPHIGLDVHLHRADQPASTGARPRKATTAGGRSPSSTSTPRRSPRAPRASSTRVRSTKRRPAARSSPTRPAAGRHDQRRHRRQLCRPRGDTKPELLVPGVTRALHQRARRRAHVGARRGAADRLGRQPADRLALHLRRRPRLLHLPRLRLLRHRLLRPARRRACWPRRWTPRNSWVGANTASGSGSPSSPTPNTPT